MWKSVDKPRLIFRTLRYLFTFLISKTTSGKNHLLLVSKLITFHFEARGPHSESCKSIFFLNCGWEHRSPLADCVKKDSPLLEVFRSLKLHVCAFIARLPYRKSRPGLLWHHVQVIYRLSLCGSVENPCPVCSAQWPISGESEQG